MPRRSLIGLLLVGAAAATIGAGTPVAAAPAPDTTTPADLTQALSAAQARLAASDAAIRQVTALLQDGTARWQAGVNNLQLAKARTTRAQQAAALAASEAARGQAALDDVVGSQYRNPQPPPVVLAFSGGPSTAADALRAAAVLERVDDRQRRTLDQARLLRQRAQEAARQAQQMQEADAARERALATEVSDLQALADRTANQVQAAQADVQRVQAERDAQLAQLARQRAEDTARAAEAARAAAAAASTTAASTTAPTSTRSGSTPPPAASPTAAPAPAAACAGRSTTGYANGNIPRASLCPLSYTSGEVLRADAAASFNRLTEAYRAARGIPICVTDAYRDYATQVRLYRERPGFAAVPGTSQHGWGVAVDLCGGIQDYGSSAYAWMKTNAGRFGWVHPAWAEPGGSMQEPWHWEFVG